MTRRTTPRTPDTPQGGVQRYRDHILDDPRHDPYQARRKYAEPTVCEDCGAVFGNGRWQWVTTGTPAGAHRERCPACRRIHDKLPAGWVTLSGPFFVAHRDELLRLVKREAEHERAEHPLSRIMNIDEQAHTAVVTTTDIHAPRRIGAALARAYDGHLDQRYAEDEYSLHVQWQR